MSWHIGKDNDPLRSGERLMLRLKEPSNRTVLALTDKKVAILVAA